MNNRAQSVEDGAVEDGVEEAVAAHTEDTGGAVQSPVGASETDPQTAPCIAYKVVPQRPRNTDEVDEVTYENISFS